MTIGELIAQREALREQKRAMNEELKAIDAQLYENEERVLEALDAAGLETAKVGGATVSISTQTMPSVNDWDAVYDFIKEHDAFYLLQRRVSTGPYREMLQMEQDVPGIEPYVQRKVNLRSTG